jgi:ribosomal protein S18 acetylase RimI-like enzyme
MLVRLATPNDAADLSAIEKSAAKLFRTDLALAWLADGPVLTQDEHERLIFRQSVWVAEVGSDGLVGFLSAEPFERELHIWELSVHKAWQRRGIGRSLIQSAHGYAAENGLAALTLTTFSDVPWCAPAYSRLGFETVQKPDRRLQYALDAEASHGLPIERRVAMRLPTGMLTDLRSTNSC